MKRLPWLKRPYGARRILDIGAGHNPYQGVTHLLEIDVGEGRERGMQALCVPQSSVLTIGDVGALPYKTGSFDFVYASHVLEHVDDPAAACREIMRVGTAGYVETPSPFLEQGLAMQDTQSPEQWIHKWFVFVTDGNRLVFEPKTAGEVFRFCSCPAGEFMKDFYASVDFGEAQHCFPGSAKRTALYWHRTWIPEVRMTMADCRKTGRECRFVGMARVLVASGNDVFRAPRLLRLRRRFPDCARIFRAHGYRSLFIH
jgi:SAM-dependent methyltransferase